MSFEIRLPELGMQTEAELARLPPGGFALEDLSGSIHLKMGGAEAVVHDDPGSLAMRVMLGAVPALRNGEPCKVLLYTSPGSAVYEPRDGGRVLLTVDGEELGLYPAAALADTFVDCAQRIGRAMAARAPGDAAVHQAADALLDQPNTLSTG